MAQTRCKETNGQGTRVRDLPERERPVSRLREVGTPALSTTELLACILQTGDALEQAQAVVTALGGVEGLGRATAESLTEVEGIGPAQAARVLAAIELGRRIVAAPYQERYQIRAPSDAAAILLPLIGNLEYESFVVLYLDTRNRVLEHEVLYKGTLNSSMVRIAEVFRGAVRRNCASIIVAHNHPSGDTSPSPEDVALTRKLVEAGKLMDVAVLDHVVVGRCNYVSLRERGLGFEGA
jgi:DNA repair protein RadC